MALPKKHRLLIQRQSLSLLRRKGRHINTPFLSAYYSFGEEKQSRLGLVIGASISKKAVVRNRLRRLLHEAIYATLGSMPIVDIIIFPKKEMVELDREEVWRQVTTLLKKIYIQ